MQFLAFPDIREISSDVTKAKFLKSQGLNHDEVKEAFIRHYVASETNAQVMFGIVFCTDLHERSFTSLYQRY